MEGKKRGDFRNNCFGDDGMGSWLRSGYVGLRQCKAEHADDMSPKVAARHLGKLQDSQDSRVAAFQE